MAIQDPNSSGQGYDASHSGQPLHAVLVSYGYRYSHSTPIRYSSGVRTHHSYLKGEHAVGVDKTPSGSWTWNAGTLGSGRGKSGTGAASLEKYLRGRGGRKQNPAPGRVVRGQKVKVHIGGRTYQGEILDPRKPTYTIAYKYGGGWRTVAVHHTKVGLS